MLDREPVGDVACGRRGDVGDVTDAVAVERALRGVDAVCHQAAKVGLGVDFGDAVEYVRDNDLGTAVLLRAMHDDPVSRPASCSRRAWSSTARVGTGAQTTASSRPHLGRADDLDAGRFEPPCPECGADLTPEAVPESARLDPRNVYAAYEGRAGASRVARSRANTRRSA